MLARMFNFSWFIISRKTIMRQSHDLRATVARQTNVVRRSMVINVRNLIGEHRANVARMLRECREKFANDSCDNRATFVRLSQICLYHPFGVIAM